LSAASQSGHLRLVLIDGEELTKLMIRFDVGVRVTRAIKIKDVDLGYFEAGDPE
jgi:restriction system protein